MFKKRGKNGSKRASMRAKIREKTIAVVNT
jgi:hypothetical protein